MNDYVRGIPSDDMVIRRLDIKQGIEVLVEAKNFYIDKYGFQLSGLSKPLLQSSKFMTISPEKIVKSIFNLNLPIERVDLLWYLQL